MKHKIPTSSLPTNKPIMGYDGLSSLLTVGEYYYIQHDDPDKTDEFIIICNDGAHGLGEELFDGERIDGSCLTNMEGPSMVLEGWSFSKNDTGICFSSRPIRLATQHERDWLDECIKQDRFVPLDEIIVHDSLEYHIQKLRQEVNEG